MNAQFRGKGKRGALYVASSRGGVRLRTTGTSDRHVTARMKAMLRDLKDQRRWTLLDAVVDGICSMGRLYDAHVARRLDELERELAAVDLAPLVDAWIADYRANGKSETNAAIYKSQVLTLIGARFLSHELTPARVKAWIGGMTGTSGTKRNRLMALRSFIAYLEQVGVLADNPIRKVPAPKKNPPAMRYESQAVDEAVVKATPNVCYAALFAFVHATGADLSPVLQHTLRGDIDLERGVTRLRGTKHAKRQVHEAIIEPWALPALRAYLADMLPFVKPWERVTRHMVYWYHVQAAKAAGVEGYTLRQARHSVAVRARKRGMSFEWIAGQLGNSVYQVATVYARFSPDLESRREEAHATADATRRTVRARASGGRDA